MISNQDYAEAIFDPIYNRIDLPGYQLVIVDTYYPSIAQAISKLLTDSLETAKISKGGLVPDLAATRIQNEVISPTGVANLWGKTGYRFALVKDHGFEKEIVATCLVSKDPDTIFFLTSKYNNLSAKNLHLLDWKDPWFDRFEMPTPAEFKPPNLHHLANLVVAPHLRGQSLAKLMLDNINNFPQITGTGLWQIADPPWLPRMTRMGFSLRMGAESFYVNPRSPLPPKFSTNQKYNAFFDLPKIYQGISKDVSYKSVDPLYHRITKVLRMTQDNTYKLQYFQLTKSFSKNI